MLKIIGELNKVLGKMIYPFLFNKKCYNERILLIKSDALGDFLFFSGILNYYIKHFGDKVYCLINTNRVDEGLARLYTSNIITLDRGKYFSSLKYRYNLLKKLNELGFSTAIAGIHNPSESRDILHILNVPKTYLYSVVNIKKVNRIKDSVVIPSLPAFDEEDIDIGVLTHEKHYLESIFNIKISSDEIKPCIPLPHNISIPIINKLSLNQDKYIVFALSSGAIAKNYPLDKFLEVIKHLYERLLCQVVLIGHEKSDSLLPDYIIDLRGKTTLIEALSIIKHSRLYIGNDTGITHAAWIMGIPTIMIYGGGNFGGFMPIFDNGHAVYNKMDCFNCGWICKYDTVPFPCVSEIKVEDIIKEAEQIIAEQ